MARKKPRVGVGFLLVTVAVIGAATWRNANLANDDELVGYFGTEIILFALGLWFLFRGRGSSAPEPRPHKSEFLSAPRSQSAEKTLLESRSTDTNGSGRLPTKEN